LFSDRWKPSRADVGGPRGAPFSSPGPVLQAAPRSQDSTGSVYSRHSSGLEQFFNHIRGETGLRLLDLSGVSQANVGFITSQGCRLYSEDLMQSLDAVFGGRDFYVNQSSADRVAAFLAQSLTFPDEHFDGALVWDVLEFLAPALLRTVVERLHRTVKPGSYLLAIFHAEERSSAVSTCSYRIGDAKTLLISPRGVRQPAQFFNNRAVEKLFEGFETVKFFLTRDHLREVIVKR
jgi:Methyltransferase domain